MKIIKIAVGNNLTNCYLLKYKNSRGFIIDPGAETEKIIRKVENEKINPDKIILTHGHFDHIGAVDKLRKKYGLDVFIHSKDADMLVDPARNLSSMLGKEIKTKNADRLLEDNDIINEFKVIHTPGHTPGGICLYHEKEAILFSGDTIFAQGRGRTDLPGGDSKALINSIKEKLFILPDNTRFMPGHGEESIIERYKLNFRHTNPFTN